MKQTTHGARNVLLLENLRGRIDSIDNKILSLLVARQELAWKIGKHKKALGLDTTDPGREQEVMGKLMAHGRGLLTPQAIRAIFTEIISASRSVQQAFRVAYLGPEGSFCHQAGVRFFGQAHELCPGVSIEDVFSLVERDLCTMGVVPVENSYHGTVGDTLDLFCEYDLRGQGEIFLRIRHNLLGNQRDKKALKYLYSHPMALSQCRMWIKENMPQVKIMETGSTSEAAQKAAEKEDAAAIASELAAQIYNLSILEKGIEDTSHNVTRFLTIGKGEPKRSENNKTSVLFSLHHRPGSLYRAIEPLARHNINMTKIESRPARTKKWEYLFFVDMQGHKQDTHVDRALKEMKEVCCFFKHLGSYPAGGEPWD